MPLGSPSQAAALGLLAGSRSGRALLGSFLSYLVVAILVWNLPSSELRRRSIPLFRPVVHALAIDQSWGLFSPDPRALSFQFEARAHFADGSVEVFAPPLGGPLLGLLRGYRWKKWSERIRRDSKRAHWEATARHFARRYEADPRGLVSLELVRRWSEAPPPGEERSWREHSFYELHAGPAANRPR